MTAATRRPQRQSATAGEPSADGSLDDDEHRADATIPAGSRAVAVAVAVAPWLAVAVPLAVAAVAVRNPQWHPIADLAQTELRVRDVGGGDTPLIGLAGRIGPLEDAGSHPGPLSFWLLAPVYRLLGATAGALSTAAAVTHALAAAVAVWVARRRGGPGLAVAVGAALVLLVVAYGPGIYVEPWNPYLPVTWWVVFLLAAWSVLDDDLPMLPVAVGAGSFCAQTHLHYLGLVAGLDAAVVAVSVFRGWRRTRSGLHSDEGDRANATRFASGRAWRWWVAAGLLGLVLWIPPLIDQATGTGNLTKIRETLSNPEEEPAGVTQGAREVVDRLDPVTIVAGIETDVPRTTEWSVAGLALLLTWIAAAVVAVRRGSPPLRRLHVVLLAGLGLAFTSAARVSGTLWFYLFLWCVTLTVLMLLAVAWTIVAAIEPQIRSSSQRLVVRRAAVAVAALVALGGSAVATVRHIDAEPARSDLSATLGVVSADTESALLSGDVAGGGRDGRYLVRWIDPVTIGSQGVGLANELERAGFDVGVDAIHGAGATRHRVRRAADATALVQLVVGPEVPVWQARDDAEQVAYTDPRTARQRAESARLVRRVDRRLRASGRDDEADAWAQNQFTAALQPGIPDAILDDMIRVLDLGAPVAVFVAPSPRS